jgi:hypothetical protein
VNYRQHEASITNAAVKEVTATYIRDYENWASVSAKSIRNATAYFVKTCRPDRHKIDFAELKRRLRFYDVASDWMNSTFQQRAAIFAAGGRTERRWLAPRIFGFRIFLVTKLAAYRLKRILAAMVGRSA